MKHKVGDAVCIKGTVIEVDKHDEFAPYKVRFENGFETWAERDKLHGDAPTDKTYEDGLQDAWELARKIYDFTTDEIEKIFFVKGGFYDVIRLFPSKEALAIFKADEEAKIKVGDVVTVGDRTFLVTCIADDYIKGIDANGATVSTSLKVKKTGKHIDIAGLLEQIKGE